MQREITVANQDMAHHAELLHFFRQEPLWAFRVSHPLYELVYLLVCPFLVLSQALNFCHQRKALAGASRAGLPVQLTLVAVAA